MKKCLIQFLVILAVASCNKRANGIKLAKELCDCFEHAKERDEDCLELSKKAEKKLMNDQEELSKFSDAMRECTMRLIKLPK